MILLAQPIRGAAQMTAESSLPEVKVRPRTRPKAKKRPRRIPPYNVILENDDYHSFEFVVEVLQKALGCNSQRAVLLMLEAHTTGRAIVWTGTKEVAELKHDQIRTFEEIRRDGTKLGPLGCSIEPAPG
jgi:ATP-dependent Clp protease adaptor protein ClpS